MTDNKITASEINYKSEYWKIKEKVECLYAENQELKVALDAEKTNLNSLKETNITLSRKVEFYKGQIEAYQYCMNCRR